MEQVAEGGVGGASGVRREEDVEDRRQYDREAVVTRKQGDIQHISKALWQHGSDKGFVKK